MHTVELAAAISELRRQLVAAQKQGEGASLRFKLAKAEIELAVEIVEEEGGQGGLKIGIPSVITGEIGGSDKLAQKALHRLKIELTPEGPTTIGHDKSYDPTQG